MVELCLIYTHISYLVKTLEVGVGVDEWVSVWKQTPWCHLVWTLQTIEHMPIYFVVPRVHLSTRCIPIDSAMMS